MLTFAGVLRFAAPKKLRIDKIIDETGVFCTDNKINTLNFVNKYISIF